MSLRGLDLALLEPWLRSTLPSRADGPLTATMLAGGRSNLTYKLDAGEAPLVLRRPPLGHVQSTAHDMAMEFRIISALAGTAVPVPAALRYRDDADGAAGVGTPFYLMDFVEGRIIATTKSNADFSHEQLRRLSLDLVEVLAALHSIDPAGVGLGDFGHPDGYLQRQLKRWRTQYEGSRNRELPDLDRLQEALGENVPQTTQVSILHGDYRLDNAIVSVTEGTPRIAAILDWEMATIGDSFADLGLLGLYWNVSAIEGAAAVPSAVDFAAGYPTFAELVESYARVRGIAVPDLSWYLAFSAYKLAIILEGIHFRFQAGETVGAGFDAIGGLVAPLADAGLTYLKGA